MNLRRLATINCTNRLLKIKKIFKHVLVIFKKKTINTPLPRMISYFWNFGSLLLFCMVLQIFSGFFLATQFVRYEERFEKVFYIEREVQGGWLLRLIHLNIASIFFICIYIHMSRSLFFFSYKIKKLWIIGRVIFILLIASAFLGYVLPWGQISFWGATVITSVFTSFPAGDKLIVWLWGGYCVSTPILTRFFSFHFIIPLILAICVILHLLFLHNRGSRNPLGLEKRVDKIFFHPFFTLKDLNTVFLLILFLFAVITFNPWIFRDPENFRPHNPLATPEHIQPEWYFLFAYAILRCIPNKIGGVCGLAISVITIFIIPFMIKSITGNSGHYVLIKIWLFSFFLVFLVLTVLGAKPVDNPYLVLSQVFSFLFFFLFFLFPCVWVISRSFQGK